LKKEKHGSSSFNVKLEEINNNPATRFQNPQEFWQCKTFITLIDAYNVQRKRICLITLEITFVQKT
jgi:hypothetical protein